MENDTFYVSTSKGRKMRAILIDAFLSHAQGHIDKHIANVEVYLQHPVGVGEHPDIMEAIETEMEEVAKYHDLKEMMERYFIDKAH
jgi:hypothetical protein